MALTTLFTSQDKKFLYLYQDTIVCNPDLERLQVLDMQVCSKHVGAVL